MRTWFLVLVSALTVSACGSPITPTKPVAVFSWRLAICPTDTPQTMIIEAACKETGGVTGTPLGSMPTHFTITRKVEYQFQLSIIHLNRPNCRVFGSVEEKARVMSSHVMTWNREEDQIPIFSYLGGLRFIAEAAGTYELTLRATDSCDVPPGTISEPVSITLVVQ